MMSRGNYVGRRSSDPRVTLGTFGTLSATVRSGKPQATRTAAIARAFGVSRGPHTLANEAHNLLRNRLH
jgi:hypothetical protein